MSLQQLAFMAAIGFGSSFFAVVSGGGGLLTIPGLIFLGIPGPVAVASTRLGMLGLSLSGAYRFRKAGLIDAAGNTKLLLVVAGGSALGALVLLRVEADGFERVFGVLTIVLAPLMLFGKQLKLERPGVTPSRLRLLSGYAFAFGIGIYAGLFGAGWATFFTYLMVSAFGLTFLQGAANRTFVGIAVGGVTSLITGLGGKIEMIPALVLFASMMTGSYLGASYSLKKGEKYARQMVAAIAVVAGVKLLFF